LSSKASGIAAPPTTFPHAPWCDPERHDDGATHPIPDANWQICFGPQFELDFGDRGTGATLDLIRGDLSYEHADVWGEPVDPCAYINFDGHDGIKLTPDQLLPVANLLRALDALHKGNAGLADMIMSEARAGIVELDLDDEREVRREATRQAWLAEAAAKEAARQAWLAEVEAEHTARRAEVEAQEAAKSAKAAEYAEAIAKARRTLAERSPRVAAEDSVAWCEQQLAAARRVLADVEQAEPAGGAA
jgi:hypothetical protein